MNELASMLGDAATRVFGNAADDDGFDSTVWARAEEAGFDRLLLAESEGGAGDAFGEAAAMLGSFGASAVALPLAETLVANWCLGQAGLEIVEGPKSILLPGLPPALHLDGSRLHWRGLLDIAWPASNLVIAVPEAGQTMIGIADLALPADIPATGPGGEPVLPLAEPSGGLLLKAKAPLSRAEGVPLALLALFKAAAIAGALNRMTDMAVDYANTRRQFGRAISGFQAVQHMLAHMASEAAATAAAVQFASRAADDVGLIWAAAIAKARASEAAGIVAALAHQIHGAIGFTQEFELHRLTRRVWSWREEAGNEAYWQDRIGKGAIAAGETIWPSMTGGLKL